MADDPRRSVVKLFTVFREPAYYQPWDLGYQKTSGGSACIVPGPRILTNAHVVAHQLHVQALKPGDTKKYSARVLHVDHDTETALLTVDDPAFYEGTVPVSFGELPARNAEISVYGFPVGGNELCITAGVVSRIEVRTYRHSQRNLLALQTDAAINPGNSGGPVFMGGKLIGIAFQSYKQKDLEKAGYVVPIPVIQQFFDDLKDDHIGGVPDLGVYWQKIENDALRDYVRLSPDKSGVRITRVLHGSSADGALAVDDVLTAIDGVAVACDGSIELRPHDRVRFEHAISMRQVGETVALDVSRAGVAQRVSATLRPYVSIVPPPRPDRSPTYYIVGGLVFMPLTHEYIHEWDWAKKHHRYNNYYYEVLPTERRKQIVLLHQVLAHHVNLGYHHFHGAIVERINGVEITEFHDVVRAFAAPVGRFHVIETDYHGPRHESSDYHASYGTAIVLDAAEAARATPDILKQHGVSADRSPDQR